MGGRIPATCELWRSELRDFPRNSSTLRCRPLVTDCTFPGCWRIELFARFHNLIVATGAVPMKGLLVGQRNQLSSDFKLDLRNFRQELRLCFRPRMTIATAIYFGSSWVFLEQVRR